MCVNLLTVKSNFKDYSVYFESNSGFLTDLALAENTIFIIDKNVYELYKNTVLRCVSIDKTILIDIAEEKKTLDTVAYLYQTIMQFSPKKNLTIVSIGGGITQDLTGFVASTLYRGVKWIYVPTTLLAQVDSCIGAKTSLNFLHYKNLIGSFYPPEKIYIYPEFLNTLTREDYYSGVGEMAKLHLMNGFSYTSAFIDYLPLIDKRDASVLLERIKLCLEIKKTYIEEDEFDTGRRNMLNYGHCFGHAIESATDFAISHGQAVVLGMILSNIHASNIGILSAEQEEFIRTKVLEPILVVNIPDFSVSQVVGAMKQDKKNVGLGLALVMIKSDFSMTKVVDLSVEQAMDVLIKFASHS